ncbi:MAG: M43 family zinc metalloprotease [Salibacteraceae bacterium]
MNARFNSLLFFLFFATWAFGQGVEECASHLRHSTMMNNNASFALRVQDNEAHIQSIIQNQLNNPNAQFSNNGVLTVPVVVHIIHTGQSVGTGANISMTQINSAISSMNDRFRKTAGTHGDANGVDVEVEFALAVRDPNCQTTDGVVRINGSSVTNYATEGISAGQGSGADEVTVKNLSKWPNTEYVNIWVVTEIEDNNGLFGIQGYAYFPGAGATVDGIVIMHTAFGTTGTVNSFNNLGRTLVHEMGHVFGLYHTFEGDNSGANCPPAGNQCGSDLGDCCGDTEIHIRASSNCPSGTNACTGAAFGDVPNNYMNYSSQTCANMFTSDQKARMRAALCGTRSGLLSSLGATAVSTPAPAAANCTPQTTNLVNNFGMGIRQVILENLDVPSGNAVGDGGYVDRSCLQATNLQPSTLTSLTVNTGTVNDQDVEVYIDYNNDGDFADAGENIFSSTDDSVHTGTFTTSASPIFNQYLRMRVIADWVGNTITGPCYTPQYGQIEDFAVLFSLAGPSLTVNTSAQAATCAGLGNGTVGATASGGQTPYTFAWSNGLVGANLNNLGAGTYTVTVTDAVSNTGTATASVTQPSALSLSLVGTDPTCSGNDGQISAGASGGTTPYTYAWSNGQTTNQVSNLAAGNFSVIITDANGCMTQGSTSLSAPGSCPTQLITPQCGTTLSSLNDYLYYQPVSGATNYRYQITHAGTGFNTVFTRGTAQTNFRLTQVSGIQYNLTYSISIAAFVGGVWGSYGTACSVTTPSAVPSTNLVSNSCNLILTGMNDFLYTQVVPGATDYRYEVTGPGVFNETYTRGYQWTNFRMAWIPGIAYGTVYSVRVAAFVNGSWGNFGNACTVITPPNAPTVSLPGALCGTTLASWQQYISHSSVPGADNYRYELVGGGNTIVYVRGYQWTTFRFDWIPGLVPNTTYSVRVAASVAGSFGAYGSACLVTTPATTPRLAVQEPNATSLPEMRVYPNPNRGDFLIEAMLDGVQDFAVTIFDLRGKIVYAESVTNWEGHYRRSIQLEAARADGVYLVRMTYGERVIHQKMVVSGN